MYQKYQHGYHRNREPLWARFRHRRPNLFRERRDVLHALAGKRTQTGSTPVKYLHFTEEVSNYGHLSDSPLSITPWRSLEDFENVMENIYDSVYEMPKVLPPDYQAEHLYELFVKPESRDRMVQARLKVRTWRLRSMNIEGSQFLNEFLSCLERLLNYLIAKTFQAVRLGPLFYEMKTSVITGFITSLESTLNKLSYLGRSLKATRLFACPKEVLQIRHKLAHSNTLISNNILEDAISFIFAWFRKNFQFHLIKMPTESRGEEFYQHRSFSRTDFDHKAFHSKMVDEFFGRLKEDEEAAFLDDLRHFARFDLNRFLIYLMRTMDTIMLLKPDTDFEYFAPILMKIVKGIFMDTPSHIFCFKFLNKLLNQIIKYEKAIEKTQNPKTKAMFRERSNRLYNLMYMMVKTIIGNGQPTKIKFFQIYHTYRKSDSMRWSKFTVRLLKDVPRVFPQTSKLIVKMFTLAGDSLFSHRMKSEICKHLFDKCATLKTKTSNEQIEVIDL